MAQLEGKTVGFAMTGSFCTFARVIEQIRALSALGAKLVPIMSRTAADTDTRFGRAADIDAEIEEICGRKILTTVFETEPIGPKGYLDLLIVAPCTGNSLAKLAAGIADTSVTMAVKAHLRNAKPVLLAVSTNDGLGANAANIGRLMARKNIYFVPFGQDDCVNKENSLVADFEMIPQTIECALGGRQIQPLLLQR